MVFISWAPAAMALLCCLCLGNHGASVNPFSVAPPAWEGAAVLKLSRRSGSEFPAGSPEAVRKSHKLITGVSHCSVTFLPLTDSFLHGTS